MLSIKFYLSSIDDVIVRSITVLLETITVPSISPFLPLTIPVYVPSLFNKHIFLSKTKPFAMTPKSILYFLASLFLSLLIIIFL